MKVTTHLPRAQAIPSVLIAMFFFTFATSRVQAANKTWDGGGADDFWQNGVNWNANTAPSPGDSLFFTLNSRLVNSNNFSGAGFTGITFSSPAGAFTIWGNSISLDGGITNNQPLLTETINLALVLSADRNVQVVNNAALTLGGVISGGFGLSKTGSGLLTLGAANSFSGTVTILAGTVSVAADNNLGAAPGAPTPGNVVINGGALRSTANLTLNANRGIALGPTLGSGAGRIDVNSGTTLTYRGIIANNGGTGGLTKGGPGTLTISSANTYTGPTSNRVGNLTLDFTQADSPVNNVISSSSALSLGGETTGVGIVNNIQLTMNGKASVVNTQSFNGTSFDVGHSTIRANSAAGGSANLVLGALSHLPGGAVTFTPPRLNAGSGEINTTSTNVNGILGGWATISSGAQVVNGIPVATNWASVDESGNIVPYTNHLVYSSGTIRSLVNAQHNLIFNSSPGIGSSIRVDVDHAPGAGTTTDLNTLTINAQPRFGINIGSNNVLRLGKFGGIFLSTVPSTADNSYELGNGTDPSNNPGANAGQNVGTLTAGGAPNTDGELVFTVDSTSQTANGSIYTEVAITDNGSGKVSVVKTGPGPMKFRGHNSFSGNMYILQGRIQMAGSELPGGAAVRANPDAFGTGDIYVLPGGQAFPSGAGGNATMPAITNNWFLAGNGVSDNVGAIRFPNAGIFSNAVMTLIGDTRLGGGGFATGVGGRVYNKITGPFNLDFGATGNSGGGANGAILYNQQNDWTGDTSIVGRTGSAGNTRLILGNNDVIPDGFGKGNLILGNTGNNNSQCVLDLNGFNETVNGLVSFVGNESIQFIENRAGTTSTLSVGNNDASSTFGGSIMDNGGVVAITKIGGGALTLTGNNTYTGTTTVNGGTLAVSGSGSIAASQDIRVNSGGTLDVSGVSSDFTAGNTVSVNGGTIVGSSANLSIPNLSLTNAQLTVVADTGDLNVTAPTLMTGGATNRINITQIAGISGYPAQFTIIDYTGTVGGAGNNIGIGEVPSTNTVGYVSNDVVNTRIVLVLLDGPKPLTWTGISGGNWDEGITTNWLAFKGGVNQASVPFNKADSTFFDDTGLTNNVNLVSLLAPGGITVSNETLNYTFFGPGGIRGLPGILKRGAGTLTLANVGVTDFRGGVAVSGGTVVFATDNAIAGGVDIASGATVQVGTNGPSGTLPAGNIANEGTLNFNRTASLTVANNISGNGSLTKNNTNIVTLSGANNGLIGAVTVVQGTLRAGSGSALGTADGNTTVNSGATLDVGGQALTTEPIIVSGAGVGGAGAIINSGAAQINALGNVIFSNNTTFGGSGRWDIRGGAASLTTGGQPYSLIKTGANQVALVGLTTIDPALADIDIQQGIFALQTTTVQVGDSTKTITVRTNAALSLFGLNANPLNKLISVQSGGAITNESGASIISGPVTLNGNSVIGVAGTSLTFDGAIGGSGNLRKLGGGTLILNAANAYSGSMTNLGGTLVVNGVNNGGGSLTNVPGTTLAGRGTHSGPVSLGTNTTFQPGGADVAGTFTSGSLTLNSARITLDLGTNDFTGGGFPANDLIEVNGNLTLSGVTTNIINPGTIGVLTNGQIITLIHYTGARTGSTNNLRLVSPPGYGFSFIDPATTTNFIRVMVNKSPLNIVWRGGVAANPTAWDIETTTNWVNAVDNSTLVDYSDLDGVSFGDTANTNRVTLVTNLQPASLTMNNNVQTYTFTGSGWLSGSSGLTVQGGGTLIIANSGTNAFTGPINISSGTLQVGDGGTSGNLGTGPLTNNAGLVFNRSGTLTVNNGIAGSGSITNNGSGVVTVGGANTHDGTVMIAQGTLRAGSGTALGGITAGTIVTNGATLDTGGQTVNLEPVTVSGAGVGGLGAIVNNVTDANNGLGNVTLEGHTTFGGTRRWDIRGGAALLSTSGNAYNLTKVGSNEVWIVNVSVDAALSNVTVQGGLLGYQDATTGLGNPAATLTVAAGGGLGFFNTTTPLDKVIVLNGSGTNNTLDARSGAANTILTSLALNGGCIFYVAAGTLTLNGGLAGSASLTKSGAGLLSLFGINAYTGNTTITGGTLALNGPASLPATPTVITIGDGATLDVTALTAGPTLTLSAGQTLRGGGSVNGSVVSPAGTTVSSGTSVGLLTVTNDLTLQGTTIMELSPLSNTNDRLRTVTGSITYGGTLIVTNLDGGFYGNDVFKLFDSGTGSYLNSFASIQLPPLPPGYGWITSQLTVDGTLRLKGPPAITSIRVSGGNVIISGTDGTNNGPYYVLASTNVALALSNWTRLETNVFDGNGNFSFTNAITTPQRFYLLQLP